MLLWMILPMCDQLTLLLPCLGAGNVARKERNRLTSCDENCFEDFWVFDASNYEPQSIPMALQVKLAPGSYVTYDSLVEKEVNKLREERMLILQERIEEAKDRDGPGTF